MPRIHGKEGDMRQVRAHRVGVEGGDAGGSELHQEYRLGIHEMHERAGNVHDGLAGADPLALAILQVDVEGRAARLRHLLQPLDAEAWRRDHGTTHEHRVGDTLVAELLHRRLAAQEVVVGPGGELVEVGMHGHAVGGADGSLVVHDESLRLWPRTIEGLPNDGNRMAQQHTPPAPRRKGEAGPTSHAKCGTLSCARVARHIAL
jgi:hypothetical protein